MKKMCKFIAPIISVAMVVLTTPYVCAEGIMNKYEASEKYGVEAKKIEYIGEYAAFSVDIPSGYADVVELLDNEFINKDDGSLEGDVFYGESENGYISCAVHESDSGFEGEVETWNELEDVSLYKGSDTDGQAYCVAEMNTYGFCAFVGEFPIGENTWVNITMSFPESEMDSVRDDINAMMSSFTRINNADNAEKSGENPDTGESSLLMIVLVLMINSFLIAFNAVKKHRI